MGNDATRHQDLAILEQRGGRVQCRPLSQAAASRPLARVRMVDFGAPKNFSRRP